MIAARARELTDPVVTKCARRIVALSIGVAVLLLAVMIVGMTDRVVTGAGRVQPAGQVQIVNHATGGTVLTLRVANGDRVAAGDVLVTFDPVGLEAETRRLAALAGALATEVVRLEAEAADQDVLEVPDGLRRSAPAAVVEQEALFKEQRKSVANERASLEEAVEKALRSVTRTRAEVDYTRRALTLAQTQTRAWETLCKQGYFPKLRLIQAQRDVLQLQNTLAGAEAAAANAVADVELAKGKRRQHESDRRGKVLSELTQKGQRLAEIRTRLAQGLAQLETLEVRAPASGIVEALSIRNAGQSVSAGEAMLHIVPEGSDYLVEVAISNTDIAAIREGQPATIKIGAFEFQRHGTLAGSVETVATDAGDPVTREGMAERVYKVLVRPSRAYVGDDPGQRLQSGMLAEVDFRIGERSIMSYMIDSILRTHDEAFRE